MDATVLDIIVLLLVGGAALLGGFRGFVTEALSLLAWVAAIVALKFAHGAVAGLLLGPVGSGPGASIAAFVLVFGITFIGGKVLARAIGNRVRQSVLGPIDRILGFGFGALKGLIGATLIFLFAVLVLETIDSQAPKPDWITDSRSYPLLNASGRALVDFVEARRKAVAVPATDHSSEGKKPRRSEAQ